MKPAPLRPTASTLAKYPVPVELITALYRADEVEFARLIATLPEYGRARMAAYCAERERLQPLSLKVARTCAEATLAKAAGKEAGAALFAESRSDLTAFSKAPLSEIVMQAA